MDEFILNITKVHNLNSWKNIQINRKYIKSDLVNNDVKNIHLYTNPRLSYNNSS